MDCLRGRSKIKSMSEMRIRDFEVQVHLGVSAEERAQRQIVRLHLTLIFLNEVRAETTDQLVDAIDYVEIAGTLKNVSEQKQYFLVEHLCRQNLDAVCAFLKKKNFKGEVSLEVIKLQVPIENLKSGVSWVCQQKLY